jgi:DNA (cytosine-5)-methyltransferase 1
MTGRTSQAPVPDSSGIPRTVLSLYTGAGGLDYGLEACGFEVLGCVEKDADARLTIKASRPDWPLARLKDIADYSPVELLSEFSVRDGEVGVLAAGPPCQPFSKAGWWYRDSARLEDPRAETLTMLMDVAEEAQPHVLLIENVMALSLKGREEVVDFIRDRLDAMNATLGTSYELHTLRLNAADFGVAQRRERLFLCACRDGTELDSPKGTHGRDRDQPHRDVWDALGDETPDDRDDLTVSGKWAGLLPTIPEGQNYLWHTSRGGGKELFGYRTRFWSFLLKLAKDLPSWTLPAQPGPATGPFHWSSRKLSRDELMRLQTFPDDVEIRGSYISAYRQLGNAVPSALAERIGRLILEELGGQNYESPLSLAVAHRQGRPDPEAVGVVPQRFLDAFAGPHSDHPGEGKGPGAEDRQLRSELPVQSEVDVVEPR